MRIGGYMVTLIRPHGAIGESLIKSISKVDGKYYVYDRVGNKMETTLADYEKLKSKGVKDRNDISKRIDIK